MSSACGGIRNARAIPVLTVHFPVLAQGVLGKGGLFVAPKLEDCFTSLTGSSTQAETGCADLKLFSDSVVDCQDLT